MKDGIVVVNKPPGMTSHDVVSCARRKLQMRRIGHAGTLDPMATGVLILLIGKSTRLFEQFVGFDKAYQATLLLGTKTVSADTQGKVIETKLYSHVALDQLENIFKEFQGEQRQVPPMVSAVKKNGQKLYQLARQGVIVEREPRLIRIDILSLIEVHLPYVKFYVECSKGTYIRQLAEDIGDRLGCGACISQIERTKVGPFLLKEAVALEELNESNIRLWPTLS